MKQFVIAATTLINNQIKTIGFAGRDDASGGYPYFSEKPFFFHEHSFTKAFIDNVADWGSAFGNMNSGNVYFRCDTNIFLEKYRQMMNFTPDDAFGFQIHLMEFDFTDVMDVKTKSLRTVIVSGRVPSAGSKLGLPVFYNATENNELIKQNIWFKTSKISPTQSLYLFFRSEGEGVFGWNEEMLTHEEAARRYSTSIYRWIELVD